MKHLLALITLTATAVSTLAHPADKGDHLVFAPQGNANGKHIVLLSGDEEYRSEESMPMLAQILAKQGFKCTVLFSMDKNNQFVDPFALGSLSNPKALDSADAIVIATRMRKWNDATMEKFKAAWERGVPFTALRTATHPFNHGKGSKWHKWAFNYQGDDFKGGWGRQVLGETWISHWGRHAVEGMRTFNKADRKDHPILNSVGTIFCRSDLYEAHPLAPSTILVEGHNTKNLDKNSPLLTEGRKAKRMPCAWTRLYKHPSGKTNNIFTTTMGSADDLTDENLRRLVVNSVYWGLGMKVPAKANVDYISPYNPTFYGFRDERDGLRKKYIQGRTPADQIKLLSPDQIRAERKKKIKGKPGNIRYIRIELPGNSRTLTLAEVEVYSGKENIAPKGIATQSSTHGSAGAGRALDGNTSKLWGDNAMTHTTDGGSNNPWWELDLGAGYDVKYVKIWNRQEGNYGERLNGFNLVFLDTAKKPVARSKNIAAPKHTLVINQKGQTRYNQGSYPKPAPVKTTNIDGPQHPAARKGSPPAALQITKKSRIAFVGGGLGSRMNIFNEFETELQRRYPKNYLYIRNMCKEGDTPAFRPHPSRKSHYVIPNGKQLVKEEYRQGGGSGHYETPDQWLSRHNIDTVIGFFGYAESFDGLARIDGYKEELRAFIRHTLNQRYTLNGAQLAIVGPAAFEDLTASRDLPDGKAENTRLKAYSKAMVEVCKEEGVLFVDAFSLTQALYDAETESMTSNGHNLTAGAYKKLAPQLADALFGKTEPTAPYNKVKAAVAEKNRLWLLDYKIPNGVHVHGRRYKPYGDDNYPGELKKTRQMTEIRDTAIWAACLGRKYNVAAADAKTHKLKEIKTNSKRPNTYLSGEEVISKIKLPQGYKLQLFACEKRFPALANPSQMAFDNQGRLWVGCMGSYPHYKIGDPLPNDSILIFEDTNNDGRADKQTAFIENIHIPMGFEITPEGGAYVSLGNDLVLLEDTNGDSKADKKTVVLSGFDDHDTHHAISAFCADPSGAIYMAEGVFSHTNVETPYGTVRGTNGGFYRFNPNKGRLERTAQYSIPNPWGIAFDDWGQNFFLHTSGTAFSWMQHNAVKPKYGVNIKAPNLLRSQQVRPTSGLEFVSSRHFPDDVQGDVILCNNIGFLGAKQHSVKADPNSGFFKTQYRHDLFVANASYQYFRPVDLEFAPDGSLYFIDWSNVLIGHMQHNARDPKRDHVHGRIYRITYPSRPLVKPAKIAGASIEQLLENLKLHEYRSRYRSRRELRRHDADKVATAVKTWVASLDKNSPDYERLCLEALWVSWGVNKIDADLLKQLLAAKDYRARTAAVRAVRYNMDKLPDWKNQLLTAAGDKHPQVRHEALIQASWLPRQDRDAVIAQFETQPVSSWSTTALKYAKLTSPPPAEPKKKLASGIIADSATETTVQINCIPKGIKFDLKQVTVKKGKKIKIIFNNPDNMQHNLLIAKPGTADKVAAAAIALGADGFPKHWNPATPEVLAATKLLNMDEKETLTITFDQPGKYPFVCTFPGHAGPMRGYIIVK